MAYNEELAERVRDVLSPTAGISERRMFGGICFLLYGNMCCGILKDELVLRLEPTRAEILLQQPHTRPMDFTGRPLKGFVYVEPHGLIAQYDLEKWISIALEFARSLPKRTAKKKSPTRRSRSLKQQDERISRR
jgi:TfoX/Sxy family transcriptional regulator of competence genes